MAGRRRQGLGQCAGQRGAGHLLEDPPVWQSVYGDGGSQCGEEHHHAPHRVFDPLCQPQGVPRGVPAAEKNYNGFLQGGVKAPPLCFPILFGMIEEIKLLWGGKTAMESKNLLEVLHVAERLKDATRHCYTSKGRHESVAEHSWRAALMAYFLRDEFPEADMGKVMLMCILHDLGESFTGDTIFIIPSTH